MPRIRRLKGSLGRLWEDSPEQTGHHSLGCLDSSGQLWTAPDIDPQNGRHHIITGANRGLEPAAARELARAGARVTMAVRNPDEGRDAAAQISEGAASPDHVKVEKLDLADLASARAFAERAETADVLLNNAGITQALDGTAADGFESQFGSTTSGTSP